MRGRGPIAAVVALMALPVAAVAQYGYPSGGGSTGGSGGTSQSGGQQQPSAEVQAQGNAFTGGLRFYPAHVRVKVGQIVRWTNTDKTVPHTATEDHGLWDLAGTYGKTPANPAGFGPGESRQRVFEAGTEHYYCRVHPTAMHGVVAVPVSVSVKHAANGKRRLILRWASGAPAAGEVYDVQIKHGGGAWRDFAKGTTKPSGRRKTHRKRVTWSVRARLRSASDPSRATGWSPGASVDA